MNSSNLSCKHAICKTLNCLATVNVPASQDSVAFRSCMTLFEYATVDALFHDALDRYFEGEADERTLSFLAGVST